MQSGTPLSNPRIVLVYFDEGNPNLLRTDPPAYYGPDSTPLGEPVYNNTDALAIECLVKEVVLDFRTLKRTRPEEVTRENFLAALQRRAMERASAFPQLNLELRIK